MIPKSLNRAHARFDPINPICILALSVVGVFFIYSAQAYVGGGQWKSQIVWIIVGAGVYLAVSLVDYKVFLKYSHWIYAVSLLLLALVLWSPLGVQRFGAQRWLDLGVYTLQPVEFAKLGCIAIGASILARSEIGSVRDSIQVLGKMALAISIPLIFIMLQPDLGSALTILPVVFAQLYASNLSKRFFLATFAAFAVLVGAIVADTLRYAGYQDRKSEDPEAYQGAYQDRSLIPLRDYQRDRLLTFIAPSQVDPADSGWNREQSLISVGSGGVFGKGWLNGLQAQLGYLPRNVAHNDFIFSVIAEETGFLGSVVVIFLFGLLLGNGIRIAGVARDRFGTLLALGIVVLFAVHIFVNIAMTIGLIPITGLPLPFLSHGGTFMLSCCIFQGLIQSVYRFRKDF